MAKKYRYNPLTDQLEYTGLYQTFYATAGQTEFVVTEMTLSDHYLVLVEGNEQTELASNIGQTITLPAQAEGAKITVLN